MKIDSFFYSVQTYDESYLEINALDMSLRSFLSVSDMRLDKYIDKKGKPKSFKSNENYVKYAFVDDLYKEFVFQLSDSSNRKYDLKLIYNDWAYEDAEEDNLLKVELSCDSYGEEDPLLLLKFLSESFLAYVGKAIFLPILDKREHYKSRNYNYFKTVPPVTFFNYYRNDYLEYFDINRSIDDCGLFKVKYCDWGKLTQFLNLNENINFEKIKITRNKVHKKLFKGFEIGKENSNSDNGFKEKINKSWSSNN